MLKKIALGLLALLLLIQFLRPARNLSGDESKALSTLYPVPQEVQEVLTVACNDCHSNRSRYPWYANVQPVAWWLADHVKDGKKHLNFSEFAAYPLRRQYHKMEETIEMVKEEEMPLKSYLITHQDARLSDAQRALLTRWAQSVMDSMQAHYPMDSLVRKR